MENRWFKNAVIYCVDVDTFRDGNGDGIGDFIGLRQALSYLAGLGVTCIWLLPFYNSPDRDNGYDITDYLSVHPHLGDLGDFAAFMCEANHRGIGAIIDLGSTIRPTNILGFKPLVVTILNTTVTMFGERMTQAIHRPKRCSRERNPASGSSTSWRRPTISIGFIRINPISIPGSDGARRNEEGHGFLADVGRSGFSGTLRLS